MENRLGEEGDGWDQLMHNLPQERLSIALSAVAQAKYTFDLTLEYAKTRRAFGDTIGSREHTKFTLASIYTEIEVAQNFVDRCLTDHVSGALDPVAAAGAKMWCTEMQQGVADRCLQIHGGYGFMRENQVARAFIDGRAQTIYGGTSEIMRQIVSKSLGL
ncbi:MAG: acyl-CoA dehydrogenase family protein [Rhodococcus sp. (in: high G+C Gram-positive bacteria)]